MTRAVLGIAMAVVSTIASASVSLDAIPVSAFARLYMTELQDGPFTICDAVLTDSRLISVRFPAERPSVAQVNAALHPFGHSLSSTPAGLSLCNRSDTDDASELFVYRPLHRDASFLVEAVSPFITGTFSNRSPTLAPAVGEGALPDPGQSTQARSFGAGDLDALVFRGSASEVQSLRSLLEKLDIAFGDVLIKAHLVEVNTSSSDGTALDVLLEALSGRVEVDLPGPTDGASIAIRTGDFSAVLSALDNDARFRAVATPSARVRSGSSVRWVVGQDVPVLGAVQIGEGGVVSQSVEYRQSGTILEVSPTVYERSIALRINQSVSSAAVTETGVSGSPTILQRTFDGEVTAIGGEVFVIAGLDDETSTGSESRGPFLRWPLSRSSRSSQRQLLLLLQVVRV